MLIHAGDIGNPEILVQLSQIAPVHAVPGNIDTQPWAADLPAIDVVKMNGIFGYVLHDVKALDLDPAAAEFGVVIYGHSHVPASEYRKGVLYFNPGSAGPRRFQLPISVGRLRIANKQIVSELITLG